MVKYRKKVESKQHNSDCRGCLWYRQKGNIEISPRADGCDAYINLFDVIEREDGSCMGYCDDPVYFVATVLKENNGKARTLGPTMINRYINARIYQRLGIENYMSSIMAMGLLKAKGKTND